MIINFLLGAVIKACYTNYFAAENIEQISIYPTEGERLLIYMNEYYFGSNILYSYQPQLPFVNVINAVEEISSISGQKYLSISCNISHFATITSHNDIIIYKYENQILQQDGQQIPISKAYKCLNILISVESGILLDCYKDNTFYFFQLTDSKLITVYQAISTQPNSSKIREIVISQKNYIVYGQLYSSNSTITLFSSQFQNLSIWQNDYIDFDSSLLGQLSCIYVLTRNSILQLVINQTYQFEITTQILVQACTFYVFQNFDYFSECDQIMYIERHLYFFIFGCEGQFIRNDNSNGVGLVDIHILNVFFNNNFMIILAKQYVKLYQLNYNTFSLAIIQICDYALVHFDSLNNQLFIFENKIHVYQLNNPALEINLVNQNLAGQTYNFQLSAQLKNLTNIKICKIAITLQVLQQNDTNIYVMYTTNLQQYSGIIQPFKNESITVAYSGQLLQFQVNQNNYQFGSFQDETLSETCQFQTEQFSLFQILGNYFIGYDNFSLFFYKYKYSAINYNTQLQFTLITKAEIKINAQQLQVAYNLTGMIMVGISDLDSVYIFQLINEELIQSSFHFGKPFSQFLLTYNYLIVLFFKKEIIFQLLWGTQKLKLDETLVKHYFNRTQNIRFHPIQIELNVKLQSSYLYVNNENNFFILTLRQNNVIPIYFQDFPYQIKQLNLVKQLLIISYQCHSNINCFQVYNVQNIRKPQFLRFLYNINYDGNIQIQSDNQLFYVLFPNYTLYVYNPYLPESNCLFYRIQLKSSTFVSQFDSYQTQIYNSGCFLFLQSTLRVSILVNQSLNYGAQYPQLIYNYTISSLLNSTAFQQTPNQSITYYTNYTYYQPMNKQQYNLNFEEVNYYQKTFKVPLSNIIYRQINYCNVEPQPISQCTLTNYSGIKINSNIYNCTIMTSINNQYFALQNITSIQILNQTNDNLFIMDYSKFNSTLCFQSTSFENYLYSICQNQASQYWLIFQLNSKTGELNFINNFTLPQNFSSIKKIVSLYDLNFILGQITNYSRQYLFLFYYKNNSLLNIGQCDDFSVTFVDIVIDQGMMLQLIQNDTGIFIEIMYDKLTDIEQNYYYQFQRINTSANFIILDVKIDQIIILFTDTNGLSIINIFYFNLANNLYFLQQVLTTIPPFLNNSLNQTSIINNEILIQQFYNGSQYLLAVYNFTNFIQKNFSQPILMFCSFSTSNILYASIYDQKNQNGSLIAFTKKGLQLFPIVTQELSCNFKKKNKSLIANITCSNLFSSGNYQFEFLLPDFDYPKQSWPYALISMLLLLLLIFIIKIQAKSRNLGHLKIEIEL
ncbi:unnamed protein product [Paramecium sonneborni]|uniref:Transmembrane protein n=1 Tax=Paramecium sonneborni TaxID=65129 RepID=A0A8S1KS54_9CILI|nr:unnamed protein product [Paramecium sonneborni]